MSEERETAAGEDFIVDERLRPPAPGRPCPHSAIWIDGRGTSCLLCGKTLPTPGKG
jgi:hypothetical protein